MAVQIYMVKAIKKSVIRLLFPLLLALPFPFTLMNCARESAPMGGPKDTIAPFPVWEKPVNNSQNINPQKIVIKFNEFIELDNVEDNCMISPVFDEKPEITVKKKKLLIDLKKQTLQPNTTYSFNFSNAIKDLTESNQTEQYLYAFSTGSGIDTMKIAGKVSLAKDGKVPEKAYVLLYDNLSDTAFKTQKPRYVTQVSKKGDFSFSNIEAKPYKIYVLEDSDKDFVFNQVTEKIGFLDTIFNPTAERFIDTAWFTHNDTIRFAEYTDSIQIVPVKDSFNLVEKTKWSDQNVHLSMFENEVWSQEVLSQKRLSKYAFACKLAAKDNKPITINFTQQGVYSQEYVASDSLVVWLIDTTLMNSDSTKLLITYKLNQKTDETKTDTLTVDPIKEMPERLLISTSVDKDNKVFAGDSVFVTLSRPLKNFDLSKVSLYENCDTSKVSDCKTITSQSDYKFRPRKHYYSQTILKHKESVDRFALYFSKPIKPEDVTVTLDGLPNLKDWYICTLDEQSNALLFWYKSNSDALRLKNTAITVSYRDVDGTIITQNFNDKKDVDVKKLYKNPSSQKRLILHVNDDQLKSLKGVEPIRIYCNNPIESFNDTLFALVNDADSSEISAISKVEISKESPRILLIYHSIELGENYTLTLGKGAIVDVFGSQSKESVWDVVSTNATSFVKSVPFSIEKKSDNERAFAIVADWKTNTNYQLVFSDSTFYDVFGDANDSLSVAFMSPKLDEFGNLLVKNTTGFPSNNLVFVLRSGDKEIKEYVGTNNPEGIRFDHLPAGSYSLICYEDANNNKKWDTGCLELKRQPEKIYFYKEPVSVKAEWENSIFWEEF